MAPGSGDRCRDYGYSCLFSSNRCQVPLLRSLNKQMRNGGPIVKSGRIEIRHIWPHERMHLGIESNPIEDLQIAQWTKEFTCQDRCEIDLLLCAVPKLHTQAIRSFDLE